MFPEYRELIAELRKTDAHFARLFQEHNRLDHKIKNAEDGILSVPEADVSHMKKMKLHIKDEMHAILIHESKK